MLSCTDCILTACICLVAAAASGHGSRDSDAAGRLIPELAHDPDGRCSSDQDHAVLLPANALCPFECPFSLAVEGVRCDKVCVKAQQCADFNPVRTFPDVTTMRCEHTCGASPHQMIAGCAECAGPGICKRCSRGLFGFTVLELSEDGRQCVNHSRKFWFSGYTIAGVLVALFLLYLLRMALRPADDGADEKLKLALEGSTRIRKQLMLGPKKQWGFFDNVEQVAASHGGLGVALYFRWLVFSLTIALILAGGSFYAFQMSDLARYMRDQAKNQADCDAFATGTEMTQTGVELARLHVGDRFQALPEAGSTLAGSFHVESEKEKSEKETEAQPTIEQLARKQLDDYADDLAEKIREFSAPLVGGKRTKGIRQRYAQFHRRIFFTSLGVYIAVTLLCWVFSALQLRVAAGSFDEHCSMKEFAAVVSGLPASLVDGRELTEQVKEALLEESQQGEKWLELWQKYSQKYEDHMGDWDDVPPEARFNVVGTSLAFDFYEHQDEVADEIHCLVNELTDNRPEQRLTTKGRLTNPEQQWTLGTQRYGQILDAVKLRQEQKDSTRFFDKFLERMVGLEPDWEYMLHGSGKAFVVFNTQVARDAVVGRAQRGELRFKWNSKDKDGMTLETTYKLDAMPAPCEPISVYWENFSDWLHFQKKIGLGVLLMLATSLMWMMLYLPYAAFYADLVVIPGLEPSFTQDMILGILIAVGNAVVSAVIERVTVWAGFIYKDTRDIAVLNLAFLGTLGNTAFDLAMVAVVAKGVQMEYSFKDNDVGYDTVAANEVFKLIVPGYLLVPYLGGPFVDRCLPFFLAYILIRSSARVTLRSAVESMKMPDFDICWRYADILNNTTICMVLLFFTSSKAWKVMCCLAAFLVLIYSIDKALLLKFATTSVYDTHRLSIAFARWWCAPTTLLAILVAYWGHRAKIMNTWYICLLLPLAHVAVYGLVMLAVEKKFGDHRRRLRWYPDVVREMRQASDGGEAWDFFNTNPIFCIRAHRLGAEESGWKAILERTECVESTRWSPAWAARRPSPDDWPRDECRPFVRGQVRLVLRKSETEPDSPTCGSYFRSR
mmetsp:Transcript_115199/g.215756  ORF Transcript_115199/g.215756 Transcript_115199/m.215756 type:complete len:1065 (+) Transcript_115199:113-3307(+)